MIVDITAQRNMYLLTKYSLQFGAIPCIEFCYENHALFFAGEQDPPLSESHSTPMPWCQQSRISQESAQ